ncbi:NAD(P)/FAD-dependent oxidoreductase [Dyella lutea]|uniref:FAD-dependent oxidoreductase n=1 Tax=Dyella lutea TaxID=2950441 RepID=A0ABT1FG62_9GAMM|nr:FAD-dependent oxidoreductase [Dyella lutea]MCP1376360.1 FAD-dependent oxidoreductase [Dyella lutea]
MRIAVIGGGISGMASAWLLSQQHAVDLYEANAYIGGHTHTHDVESGGRDYAVDSGFIVFNPDNYPLLTRLFGELGVDSQPTTMSFAVHNEASGLEYGATSLDALFCQRRNLLSPKFYGMVRDIVRFYRESPALLETTDAGPTLGDYLERHRYGAMFRDEHIVPMASALWSSPSRKVLDFPARYLVQFMANHHMLQLDGRPEWRVVRGGSTRYVDALRARWNVRERIASPVTAVRRVEGGVEITSLGQTERYDQVVLACHSNEALAMLADATPAEREVLGAIRYQENDTVLHTDTRLLPKRRKAWSAWNVLIPASPTEACTVTYCMNLLQTLDAPDTFCVSLNCADRIDPARVIRRMRYAHPEYTHASVAAQQRKGEIQGRSGTWFAGAYWGWGFHEDGMRSAVEVARALGVDW